MEANVESSRGVGMHKANKKVSTQNIEIGSQKQHGCPLTSELDLQSEHPHPKHLVKKKRTTQNQKGPLEL
jgi:hypothetical protein